MLVNCSNTQYRDSYLEWGSGIGNEKDAALQGTLSVQVSDKPLFTQRDLTRGGKNIGNGVIRMENTGKGVSGISTKPKAISGGSAYTLTFEARGNYNLIVMLTGKGFKRIDPLKNWQPLSGKWKKFKAEFDLPAEAKNTSLTFFYWNQPGRWFEIRNFKVMPR